MLKSCVVTGENVEKTGLIELNPENREAPSSRRTGSILLGAGLFFLVVLSDAAWNEIRSLQMLHVKHETEKSERLKSQVEFQFNQVYRALRTLVRLPAVKKIDRYGKNFDEDGKRAAQEIYNNLYNTFKVSEIYIVPEGLDPDQIDPVTGKPQEPIVTFDEFIVDTQTQAVNR